jgi:hypothetical protein
VPEPEVRVHAFVLPLTVVVPAVAVELLPVSVEVLVVVEVLAVSVADPEAAVEDVSVVVFFVRTSHPAEPNVKTLSRTKVEKSLK